MIVNCSKCATGYTINERQVQGGRVLLRCPTCRSWFSVAITAARTEPPVVTPPELPKLKEIDLDDTNESTESHPAAQEVADSASANGSDQTAVEAPLPPLKVLIADAPNPFRQRILNALNRVETNLETVVADDGRFAIDRLEDFTPDAAIIGTGIENVYCFEICDYIRSKERLKDARIIFASELHEAAWNCGEPESLHGADAWLSNASTDEELLTRLTRHLNEARMTHQETAS
ncbi:MAG TPA: zinc-ribbon domain-containing protein [Blastocatellia bacterium]|nr:zinc-ribbon domain-containing protein [Blastocatellia bacterium]